MNMEKKSKKYDISEIGKLYPNWYDKKSNLSYDEQKWIWENVPLPEEDEKRLRKLRGQGTNERVYVNGNATYENRINDKSIFSKHEVIAALKKCNHRTPPKEIASLLEQLFSSSGTTPEHCLYVAQHWPPIAINRTLTRMLKQHQRGEVTIKNPAAYFTHLIKFRKKRKSFTRINDTHKQQNQ